MGLSATQAHRLSAWSDGLPFEAWVPLAAAGCGVRLEAMREVFDGAGTVGLDVKTAVDLVGIVAHRWGVERAEALTRNESRVSVTAAVLNARSAAPDPDRPGAPELVRTVDRAVELLPWASTPAVFVLDADDRVRVLVAVAEVANEGLRNEVEAVSLAWSGMLARLPNGPGMHRSSAAADMLGCATFGRLDGRAAGVVTAVMLGIDPQLAAMTRIDAAALAAAAEVMSQIRRSPSASGASAVVGVREVAVAAALFVESGVASDLARPFGVATIADMSQKQVAGVLEALFVLGRARWSRPGRRPFVDAALSEIVAAGLHAEVGRSCLGWASSELPVEVAASLWSSDPKERDHLAAEFAAAALDKSGPHWSAVEVLEALACRPEFDAAACAALPAAWSRTLETAADRRPIVEHSMRTVGLGAWATSASAAVASMVTEAAPEGFSAEAWATLWSLLDGFVGTPDELVALVELSAPT